MRNDSNVCQLLRQVAPGTGLREGLDNVLRAKTGALIVIGNVGQMEALIDGGFYLNCDMTPASLYELAKMDGAIIISEDGKKILYANTLLIPDAAIPSSETGIRHRTAERVAKQTRQLVVSISQRRNIITLYKGDWRYALKDIGEILGKANQAVQTLDKYKTVLNQALNNLSALEFEDLVTFNEVATVIQRIEMVLRVKEEIERYIIELGTEGRLISMQMEELIAGVELEAYLLIKDYCNENRQDQVHEMLKKELQSLTADELLEAEQIIRILGYPIQSNIGDHVVYPRGFRLLTKIPRLPIAVVDNMIEQFGTVSNIIRASVDELDEVEGIGAVRAKAVTSGLRRIREQVFFERHI